MEKYTELRFASWLLITDSRLHTVFLNTIAVVTAYRIMDYLSDYLIKVKRAHEG